MKNLNFEIEKIKYKIFQKEIKTWKIKELEKLLESQFINNEQIKIVQKKIEELKYESSNNQFQGIEKLKKFRLSLEKTSEINENPKYIYPELLESGKIIMFFGDSGIGKTLMCAGFANYGLKNKTIDSVVFFDFDNGLISLKKRKYDQLAERWGEGKFDYLLGDEILQEMEPIEALKELALDGEKNKNKMIVIDSGSHFVYDGSKNEREKLKEFFNVIRVLRSQQSTPLVIHHSHRVREGQTADYHGSFEWKRDLDYQILITKNEQSNTWLFHVKKDRDNLIVPKAFQYSEDTVSLYEVDFAESNISRQEYIFIREIRNILNDFNEKINQSDLMKETKDIRESIGLGEKRFIKWLQIWAERGKWNCEKIASEKNSIFYWIDDQTDKLAKVPNIDKTGV
jgi:KaiC/GvpD/RAD55 family RecA-like ATPase